MLKAFGEAARLCPDNLDIQFRCGESFYDVEKPDWQKALDFWTALQEKKLSEVQAAAVKLHRAKVLINLGRKDEARALAESVNLPALERTRQELLKKISSDGEVISPPKE